MKIVGGDKFLYFLAGAGIGAVLALFFAPKSGRETREMIARTASDSRDFLTSQSYRRTPIRRRHRRKVTDDFSSFVDRSKEALESSEGTADGSVRGRESRLQGRKGSLGLVPPEENLEHAQRYSRSLLP